MSIQHDSRTILVIDDDITALDLVSFLFEERGYTVVRKVDGHSAINFVKGQIPSLIIVDLMMPEINGVETVRQIRGLGASETPVIAFTAVDDPLMHEQAREAGCDEVITKPCPAERLVKTIKKYLSD